MRGSAARPGKQREQRPAFSFLNEYPIASLLGAALLLIWVVTRTLVFMHIHERAADHIDFLHMRQSKIRPSEAKAAVGAVQQSSTLALQQTTTSAVQEVKVGTVSPLNVEKDKCHPKKNMHFGGATGEGSFVASESRIVKIAISGRV